MRLSRYILVLIVFSLLSSPAYAVIYQYFDQDGTLIITDNPHGNKRPKTPQAPPVISSEIRPAMRQDVYYEYYTVSGRNIHEILSNMSVFGPFDSKAGKNFAAQTKWHMGWSYKLNYTYKIEDNILRAYTNIYDVDFKSDISVLLPSPTSYSMLDAEAKRQWEQTLKHLIEHEHDHVNIIKDPFCSGSCPTLPSIVM